MKTLDYYRNLPDVMSSTEVAAEFAEILSDPDCAHISHDTVAVLSELSERQWNTYTLLGNHVRGEVERLLEKFWRDDDADLAEVLFGVAGRLGVASFLSFVSLRGVARMSAAVQFVVVECVAELQETIADPYSGLQDDFPGACVKDDERL